MVSAEVVMIETPYKFRFPVEVDIKETEAGLQETYPGVRLARGHYDFVTNEWLYTMCFDQEKDYTWFTLTK